MSDPHEGTANENRLWLDIGNTRTHWWLNGGRESGAIFNAELLNEPGAQFGSLTTDTRLHEVVCACVGAADVLDVLQQRFGDTVWLSVQGFPHHQLSTVYDTAHLGLDRWLALLGAQHHCRNMNSAGADQQGAIVVDAGTALTVDVLQGSHHLGGWIMPGLYRWHHALYGSTQIRRSMLVPEAMALGHSTPQAIAQAWLVSVKGLVDQARAVRPAAEILLTGGDVDVLHRHWSQAAVCPDLILNGMKVWRAALEKQT